MKTINVLTAILLGASLGAPAARYDSGFAGGRLTSDNTSPYLDTRIADGLKPVIEPVSVTLNLSEGHNGDLCAYLSCDGSKLVLLSEVGAGTGSGRTSAFGCSDAAVRDAVLRGGGSGGASDVTCPVDEGEMIAEELGSSDTTGLSGTSQQTLHSQFGGLNPLHLALVGLGVCAAGAGFGLRFYARARAEC